MPAARVEYIAPWWVVWLHSVPHLGLRLQPVDSTFRPRDESYQESLLFLGLVAAICLGLNLIFLAAYLVCACCCRQNDAVQTKRRNSCCVTWTAVVAGLICCAAVGVGFYGNSETNDGVYQLIYSLDNANSTFSGIDELVSGTTQRMKVDLEQHLARLSEIFAARGDYLQTLKFIQQMAGSILVQMAGVPAWREVTMQLTELADQTGYVEYYRWLSYLLLFVLDLVICLLTCLGLAKRSRCLLASMLCCGMLALLLSWTSLAADAAAAVGTSDFCVAPDTFILNITEGQVPAEVTRYYLYCSQSGSSPFQQALTVFQRSLTSMQIQVAGLLQFAVPLFPTAEKDLLGIQLLLNSSESSLHQLTAMLDCRGLHKVLGLHLPREKPAKARRVIVWAPSRLGEWGGSWALASRFSPVAEPGRLRKGYQGVGVRDLDHFTSRALGGPELCEGGGSLVSRLPAIWSTHPTPWVASGPPISLPGSSLGTWDIRH
uniref:Protein tweety homolog n=1 Tax=Sus scrofa TaxID=9823 RepID=F1RV50_PIG